MRPAERSTAIRNVTYFLAPLSRSEVRMRLSQAGSSLSPPEHWGGWSEAERKDWLFSNLGDRVDIILEALLEMLPEDEEPGTGKPDNLVILPRGKPSAGPASITDGPIFVVHGHAHATLYQAVRILERGTGLEVTVLHEQANAGRTILEKFEDYGEHVSFAVVLVTGDDEGGIRSSGKLNPRGRQNVIFELGFFFAKLGRKRVAVLLEENVEKPSDIDGLVYISLDEAGAWKYALAKELEAAGIPVDRARIL